VTGILETDPEPTDEDLVLILGAGRHCQSSNARDSIYGFLGLMSENIANMIEPDYNKSVAEVFRDVAIQLINCTRSFIIFSLTQYTTAKDRGAPTWVPSWHSLTGLQAEEWDDRLGRLSQRDFFLACAEHTMSFEFTDGNDLKLSGARLDHVASKGNTLKYNGIEEALERHEEWKLLYGRDGLHIHDQTRYIIGGKASDAYWRTLMNGIYYNVDDTVRRRCQDEDHIAYLEWLHEAKNSTA
jgi:hypothetical protein